MDKHLRISWLRRALALTGLVVLAAGCTPEELILLQWQDDGPAAQQQAVTVATCESTLQPDAVSAGNYGLFQINRVHAGDFTDVTGHPFSDVLDPVLNVSYAHHLWEQQGWGPWACRP